MEHQVGRHINRAGVARLLGTPVAGFFHSSFLRPVGPWSERHASAAFLAPLFVDKEVLSLLLIQSFLDPTWSNTLRGEHTTLSGLRSGTRVSCTIYIMKVMVDLDRAESPAVRLASSTPEPEASTTAGWCCPFYTRAVHEALRDKERAIVQRLEQSMPSVWPDDDNPTMRDIETWRVTLIRLLCELQVQFDLPFAWLTLQHNTTTEWVEEVGGQCPSPAWPVFCGRTFAAFYRRESLKQTGFDDGRSRVASSPGRRRCSFPLATFEELYEQYFCSAAVDESKLDRLDALSGNQVMVWSMLSALYTIDLMGEALESDVVAERVEQVLRMLWPCVRHVAMGEIPEDVIE